MLAVIALLGGLVALAVIVLVIKDRIEALIWKRRYTPEKLAELEQHRVERLLRSDWDFFERHLERPVPAALRELYGDQRLMSLPGYLEYDRPWNIVFQPLLESECVDSQALLGVDIVPLGCSECGDPIYLRPGKLEPDAVYVTCHDSLKTEMLAPSVEEFMRRLRELNPPQPSQNSVS